MINVQDNPRLLKSDDRCLGGEEQAIETIELFQRLNKGDKNQKIMADGVISNLIKISKISKRVLAEVLKIGTGRIKRKIQSD